MGLRNIPDNFAAPVVAAIDARLQGVEDDQDVRIVLAIGSGSRAWGFPSPDSDYDCRFVYVRSVEQYLSPWVRRDVIETPLDAVLDVNGRDLGKALKLLLKGNAVIIEWLVSPIIYSGSEAFRTELLQFAMDYADRSLIGRHYLHLGERQRRTYFGDGKDVQLKKIFYALRPAAALCWLRLHPDAAVPPMHFPTLMAEINPPSDVAPLVADLMARKAQSRELGSAPLPEPIRFFMDREFELATRPFEGAFFRPSPSTVEAAEMLFRRHVGGIA